MPVIQGRFDCYNGMTFTCSFKIGGGDYSGSGKYNASVAPFNTTAMLTYCIPSDIMGSHPFSIVVGRESFTLKQNNGVVIEGALKKPVSSRSEAEGKITWVVG